MPAARCAAVEMMHTQPAQPDGSLETASSAEAHDGRLAYEQEIEKRERKKQAKHGETCFSQSDECASRGSTTNQKLGRGFVPSLRGSPSRSARTRGVGTRKALGEDAEILGRHGKVIKKGPSPARCKKQRKQPAPQMQVTSTLSTPPNDCPSLAPPPPPSPCRQCE